ncbi:unnamed protein product, partial [Closterium sp. Yama58-4]
MGLLLGDIHYDHRGRTPVVSAKIWGAAPHVRADRRKDRVETTPEQLAAASAEAERMSAATGMRTRVIGWYHSHPHITVHPSHVDVRTQGMYQMLDEGFVGLIFSAFNRASSHAQVSCRSAAGGGVSVCVSPRQGAAGVAVTAHTGTGAVGAARHQEHSSHPSVSDLEPQELAVVLAAVDDDVPSSDFTSRHGRMLLMEEKEAYERAVEHAGRHGEPNPLELIHHHATYQAALCRLMETCVATSAAKSPMLAEAEIQARGYRAEAAHLKSVLATVLGEFRDVDTTEAVAQIAELCQLLAVTDPHCLPSAITHLSTRAWHCEQLLQRMEHTQTSLQARQEQVASLAECIE